MTITVCMRIAGVVDSSGDEIIFSSRPSDSPSGTVVGGISSDIRLNGGRISPMQSLASSGGTTVSMVYSPSMAPLLRRDLEWPGSGLEPPRVASSYQPGDTTIELNTSGLPNGLIWIAGEVMEITGSSGALYTVTRAVGSLGVARSVQFSFNEQGPIVLSRQPTMQGARVRITTWDGSSETTQFRGYVNAVSVAASTVTVDIGSCVAGLRLRTASRWTYGSDIAPAQPITVSPGTLTVTSIVTLAEPLSDYVRLWFGDSWVVVTISVVSGQYGETGTEILQWGQGSVPFPLDNPPDELANEPQLSSVEPIFSIAVNPPSVIASAVMQAQEPTGGAGGLDADDIGDLSALDRAFGAGNLTPAYAVSTGDWWPLPSDASDMATFLAEQLAAPLSCAIASDSVGRIIALDWARAVGSSFTVDPADLFAPATVINETQGVRLIDWSYKSGQGTDRVMLQSDYNTQVAAGGRTVKASPGWFIEFAGELIERLRTVLTIWQYPAPTTTLELASSSSVALDPGDVFRLSVPTIIGRDGLRGIVNVDGVVLESGRVVQSPTRSVTVALTGYTAALEYVLWAQSGVVAGVAGSVLTIVMDNLDAAEDWFPVSTEVQLLDENGVIRDTGLTVSAASLNDITVTGLTVTPVASDRLVLADGTVAEYPLAAYLSRGQNYV